MAIIGDKYYNLRDYASQFDPAGRELAIAEVLSQTNEIIADALVKEGNIDSGYEYAVRTGIPKGTWRRLYQGVDPAKTTTKVVTESYGILANLSLVDKDLAEKGGNVNAVRANQSKAVLEGMSKQMAETLIYGDAKANPERFTGLAGRYTLDPKAESTRNVIDAGNTTANKSTSIYLVVWDTDKVFTFFPKGSKAGIERMDHGLTFAKDENGKEFLAYKEYFSWKMGLAVQDWRFAGRIVNVPAAPTAALLDHMMDLEERIQSLTSGRPVWYMNRQTKGALRKLLSGKANVQYTPAQPNARPVMLFDEIPVHVCDAISNEEAVVAAPSAKSAAKGV